VIPENPKARALIKAEMGSWAALNIILGHSFLCTTPSAIPAKAETIIAGVGPHRNTIGRTEAVAKE